MFLRNFVKKGLLDAIGKMADYQIILNAMGWFEKGVLLEEDLIEINQAIEDSHKEPEPVEPEIIENEIDEEIESPIEEEIIEEPIEEDVDETIEDETPIENEIEEGE